MLNDLLRFWWLAGTVLIWIAAPLALIMIIMDHRRHRHWPSTGLAMVWCVLALAFVGAVAGTLSPPLFGVPLVLLYSLAWSHERKWFVGGVTTAYCLGVLVVIWGVIRRPEAVGWPYVLAWPASLVVLLFWHRQRPARNA